MSDVAKVGNGRPVEKAEYVSLGTLSAKWRWTMAQADEGPDIAARRASLSSLKRVRAPVEAMTETYAVEFVADLLREASAPDARIGTLPNVDRLFELVAVMSHVDVDTMGGTGVRAFGRFLAGSSKGDGQPRLNLMKFNSFLRSGEEGLIDRYRRLLDAVGNSAPVAAMATAVAWHGRDEIRRDLAIGYHNLVRPYRSDRTNAS